MSHPFRQSALTVEEKWRQAAFYPALYPTRMREEVATDPAVSDHFKSKDATDAEVDAAGNMVLADPTTEAYPLAKGRTFDLVEATCTNTAAAEPLKTDTPARMRDAVRTGILAAHPVKL
ncbi:hypothetical protein [Methylobacterium sp. NEAU K]|uniref:hypothetical protein n=1 Tax=Methylobacterium sp. NEAU K TaxID=3064946 RepID=UPI0027352BA1|nr:hypothetical protein [Methylobacterium sp. NEAU K]MDP4005634.1 hypothetical protein [Methylobacterium sp. NEAU K]